jgi:hypothetical protein
LTSRSRVARATYFYDITEITPGPVALKVTLDATGEGQPALTVSMPDES